MTVLRGVQDARATVTVTDLCVPNPARGKSDPCKGARAKHMALPCKVFSSIVNSTALNAQSAPILFRRYACSHSAPLPGPHPGHGPLCYPLATYVSGMPTGAPTYHGQLAWLCAAHLVALLQGHCSP